MSFSIDLFRNSLNGGVRPNLFTMSLSGPAGGGVTGLTNFTTLCKAGAIPALTLGIIEVPFRGRRAKIPGDRSYGEWTATFINTADQSLRAGFETWLTYIADNDYSTISISSKSATDYKSTITINQLKDDGTSLKTYVLQNAFPSDVSAIDLSYDTVDAIEEFTVTFQYSHFI
jgi:hypothetical protein